MSSSSFEHKLANLDQMPREDLKDLARMTHKAWREHGAQADFDFATRAYAELTRRTAVAA